MKKESQAAITPGILDKKEKEMRDSFLQQILNTSNPLLR